MIKAMKQEQAAIIYNYLVTGAIEAVENDEYDPAEEATLKLKFADSDTTIVADDDCYIIGPMTIETTGE